MESLDHFITESFLGRLPVLEPDDPILAAIADRWVKREDPEVFAKRDAIEAEIQEENARLADLEDARYVRGEFDGPDATDRYNRLAGRLKGRVDGLRANLAKLPTPAVDLSPILDGAILREAWEDDDTPGRRERLRLAIDRVVVSKGRVGARFNGTERVTIVWAGEAHDPGDEPAPGRRGASGGAGGGGRPLRRPGGAPGEPTERPDPDRMAL